MPERERLGFAVRTREVHGGLFGLIIIRAEPTCHEDGMGYQRVWGLVCGEK